MLRRSGSEANSIGLALSLAVGLAACAPAGRAVDSPPAELLGSGAALGFLRVGGTQEVRLLTREQLEGGALDARLVVPEGEDYELLLFVYECETLGRLGIEVLGEPPPGAYPEDELLYPRVQLGGEGLALRAPERLLLTVITGRESTPWRSVRWAELELGLREAVAACLPRLAGASEPFVEAPLCGRYRFESLPEVVVEDGVRSLFAVAADERHALVALGRGELWEIDEAGGSRLIALELARELRAVHVEPGGRLWAVRVRGAGLRTLETTSLSALRAGDPQFELRADLPLLRDVPDGQRRDARSVSLAAAGEGAPFELFIRGGDGLLARYDGQVLTSTFTTGQSVAIPSRAVVWREPGRVWVVDSTGTSLAGYRMDSQVVLEREEPLSLARITALVGVPGLGIAVGDEFFRLGIYEPGDGLRLPPGFERFAATPPNVDRVEALLPAPRGFIAAGDKDRLVRYYRQDLERGSIETLCVLNELRPDGTLNELRHIYQLAYAGESLVLVPLDFAGRRFLAQLARPLGSACEPGLPPRPR